MYRSICVPLDGSPVAEHALPWALSIAQRDKAAIHLTRVHISPVPIMVGSEMTSDVAIDTALRDAAKTYLADISARLQSGSTSTVNASLIEGGIADAIQDHARSVGADLIVMTTHGRGAFARFWLGSVADKIMRHSTIPTLFIRPNEEQAANLTTRPFPSRIVLPLDGSELAERIIDPAIKLARSLGAEFSLVLVLDAIEDIEALSRLKLPLPGGWFPEATQAKAEMYLERIAHRLRGHSMKVTTKVIRHGQAATAVLDYANSLGNSVIALATHGRSGVRRMFMGSVTDKIVRAATMPVLVFHPAEGA